MISGFNHRLIGRGTLQDKFSAASARTLAGCRGIVSYGRAQRGTPRIFGPVTRLSASSVHLSHPCTCGRKSQQLLGANWAATCWNAKERVDKLANWEAAWAHNAGVIQIDHSKSAVERTTVDKRITHPLTGPGIEVTPWTRQHFNMLVYLPTILMSSNGVSIPILLHSWVSLPSRDLERCRGSSSG